MEKVKCYCNLIAEVKTSHTPNNPNRDFYRCSKPQKCKFWSWADELQPTQPIGTPSPAASQVPASPTSLHTPMKRTASVMEEPSDLSPASQKRIRVMEAVLGAGGSSGHPETPSSSPNVSSATFGGTPNMTKNIDIPQASPSARYKDVGTRLNSVNVAFPQTPTRSARRSAIYSPSLSPNPFDLDLGNQQSNTNIAQDDNAAYPLGSGELTPELIGNMVNILGNIPDYIGKLDRKLIAAEKSLDARNKKIEYLEHEVKRLRDRQEELEHIIAGYETKGL